MEPIGILIIAALVLGAGFLTYAVARRRYVGALALIWSGLALIALWAWSMAVAATGWDGLTYAILLMFGCLPAAVGGLIGSVAGWYRREPRVESNETRA